MAVLIKRFFGQMMPSHRQPRSDLESWSAGPTYGTVHASGLKSTANCDENDQSSESLLNARSNGYANGDLPTLGRTQSEASSFNSDTSDFAASCFCVRVSARTISDATIGLSDGLTVPFALTAGLSGLGSVRVVVLGGLAELVAGAISMGLGGWMGARSEAQSEALQASQTHDLCESHPSHATSLVSASLQGYGLVLTPSQEEHIRTLPSNKLTDLVQHLQHGQLPAATSSSSPAHSPLAAALTIAAGYFAGGFIPLLPYVVVWTQQDRGNGGDHSSGPDDVLRSLYWSVAVMAVALMLFGWAKVCCVSGWTGRENLRRGAQGALEMVVMGGAAAGAAVGLVRAIQAE